MERATSVQRPRRAQVPGAILTPSQHHIVAKCEAPITTAICIGKYHMTPAGFAVAVIAFLALSRWRSKCAARARKRRHRPEPTLWDHNGSVMYLVANGSSREFYYQKPRPGILEVGDIPALFYSKVKSTNDNIREQRISLTRIADQSRSKSKDQFWTMMNGSC